MKELKDVKEIRVIPYCHTDYAWTNFRDWHIGRYCESYKRMLKIMDEHPEYTAVLDNIVHSLVPFLRYCPEEREHLIKHIREGRIDICPGGYALMRPTQMADETLVRNLADGDRKFRELFGEDLPIETYFNADTDMGHSQLPQIVRLMGYKYYQFQRPEDYLDKTGIAKEFRWRGLDGSEILCGRGFYGGFSEGDYITPESRASWEEKREKFVSRELPGRLKNLPTSVIQQFHGIDDSLPLTDRADVPLDLFGFFADWNKNEESRMFFSTLTGSFHAIEKEEVPTYSGCLEPHELTYNAPSKANAALWRLRLLFGDAILQYESARAILEANGGEAYPEADVRRRWEGLYEIIGHAMEFTFAPDFARKYHEAYALYLDTVEKTRQAVEAISDLVGCGGEDEHVVVNPHAYPVTVPVRLLLTRPEGVLGFRLVDDEGNDVPYQLINVSCGDKFYYEIKYSGIEVMAKVTLPPCGARVIRTLWEGDAMPWLTTEEKQKLLTPTETPRREVMDVERTMDGLTAVFRGGALLSLSREGKLCDTPAMRLRFTKTDAPRDWLFVFDPKGDLYFTPEKGEILTDGPVLFRYAVTGKVGSSPAVITYTLGELPGALTVKVTLENREACGWFAVDFGCDETTPLTVDIPFGWEKRDPAALAANEPDLYEITVPGQYYAKSWSSFTRAGEKAAVLTKDTGTYWRVLPGEKRVTLLLTKIYDCHAPAYDQANSWLWQATSTALTGKHEFTFALTAGEESPTALADKALLLRRPVLAERSWRRVEKRPAAPVFRPVSGGETVLTALYMENGAYICRFYESAGKPGVLRAAVPGKKAVKLDLRRRETDAVPVKDGIAEIPLRPFEIVTLKIDAEESVVKGESHVWYLSS